MAELETGRAEVRPGEVGQVTFSFRIKAIAVVLLAGFLLRLLLASLPGFEIDLGTFQAWSLQLADRGPWNFYDVGFFADYMPGYLYILWLIGGLNDLFQFDSGEFHYVLKLPAVFADLASAYLLYWILEGQRPLLRLGAPALYLLFPATLLIGPVWGQVDSLLVFFLLLCVYYLGRGRPVAGALAFTVGFLTKPQAVAALPFLAFWFVKHYPLRIVARAVALSLAAGFLLILPFFPDNPWALLDRLVDAANVENYRVTSFWAYNFWAVASDLFKPDNLEFLGLTYRLWSFLLFALAIVLVIFAFRRSEGTAMLALGSALSVLAFYLFLTRMHERYLFPFFPLFLVACAALNSRLLWGILVGLGLIHVFNLYYVYSYPLYNPNGPAVGFLFSWIEDRVFLFSLLTTLAFPLLLAAGGFLMKGKEDRLKGVHPEEQWLS